MKIIFTISRIFAGLVFVFSGFVKAVDPMGFGIKLGEYFDAFHLGFFHFTALPLAIAFSAAELMIGLNLLANLRMKFTSWALLLFMSFFTVLTLVLALFNPVSDCGCFGDAVKLTNWQTFWKNIVLIIPALVLFLNRSRFSATASPVKEWTLVASNLAFACIISIFCIIHQPIIDFRPYKTGTYIPEGMKSPVGTPVDEYVTLLVYEKNGHRQEFTDKNFPWQDSSWKWVETRQKLIKKGFEPPIHDFSITTSAGVDITDKVLADSAYVFLFIIPDVDRASDKGMLKLNDLALRSRELGFRVYGLTSSTNSHITAYTSNFQPAYDFCSVDETTLKTISRANPGVLLLLRGTIVGKWNYRDAPSSRDLKTHMLSAIIQNQNSMQNKLSVAGIFLFALVFYSFAFRWRKT